MRALLVSTYDLGRQPFGLASPAAWLGRIGWEVDCADVSKDRLTDQRIASADLIAFHLPMHTATRLSTPLIANARRVNPTARLCAYGLYAPPNRQFLSSLGVDDVLGGEFEEALTRVAQGMVDKVQVPTSAEGMAVPRLAFLVPDRSGLPPLARYAALQMPDGTRRVVGSTEASRGCQHLCRHCPVVPVYQGQFRVVSQDVVLGDIDAQVAAGAEHITFGDPDFFNGPTHALRVVEALHRRHPGLTYDVTIKIEHLLDHRDLVPRLVETGCLFVTSAVESVDDRVLVLLEKGHTRQGFVDAVGVCRGAGLAIAPTFVAFHPWLKLSDYCDLLNLIAQLDLVEQVAPIQLAIRLLIPHGSRLLELEELRPFLGAFNPATLSYAWTHPDPRVDRLASEASALVGHQTSSSRRAIFEELRGVAHDRAGLPRPELFPPSPAVAVPFLTEPWYCCAEPNPDDMRLV
jgi:radical SAM superfamily enzyme YgiQ (UPF0313 family)